MEKNMTHESGNSALLIEYIEALHKAYELGNAIREVYGIVPPTAYLGGGEATTRLSLNVH
jgi:hypothetical protein